MTGYDDLDLGDGPAEVARDTGDEVRLRGRHPAWFERLGRRLVDYHPDILDYEDDEDDDDDG